MTDTTRPEALTVTPSSGRAFAATTLALVALASAGVGALVTTGSSVQDAPQVEALPVPGAPMGPRAGIVVPGGAGVVPVLARTGVRTVAGLPAQLLPGRVVSGSVSNLVGTPVTQPVSVPVVTPGGGTDTAGPAPSLVVTPAAGPSKGGAVSGSQGGAATGNKGKATGDSAGDDSAQQAREDRQAAKREQQQAKQDAKRAEQRARWASKHPTQVAADHGPAWGSPQWRKDAYERYVSHRKDKATKDKHDREGWADRRLHKKPSTHRR
jgi:hypothetical protein